MHGRILLSLAFAMGAIVPVSLANAQNVGAPSWSAQAAIIDFSAPESAERFAGLVEEAHEKTILYLDWTFRNAAQSGLYVNVTTDDNAPVSNQAICEHVKRSALRPGGFVISGKPDPDNNHLLFEMTVDLATGAPFARARCEYAQSRVALRLRGFST